MRHLTPTCNRSILRFRITTNRAFTLIELLSVIAVIGILVAILIPAVGNMRSSAMKVKDATNLRQMGAALNLYLTDHKMMLPVVWVSLPVNPDVVEEGEYSALTAKLAPYLGIDGQPGDTIFVEVAQSPTYPEQLTAATAATSPRLHTYRLVLAPPGKRHPFGGRAGAEPFSILTVADFYNREHMRIPVIFNLDNETAIGAMGRGIEPAFGDQRNVLYLDGHVEVEEGLSFLNGFR